MYLFLNTFLKVYSLSRPLIIRILIKLVSLPWELFLSCRGLYLLFMLCFYKNMMLLLKFSSTLALFIYVVEIVVK